MLLNKLKARLSSFEEAFSTASEKMADILQVHRPEKRREEERREEKRREEKRRGATSTLQESDRWRCTPGCDPGAKRWQEA